MAEFGFSIEKFSEEEEKHLTEKYATYFDGVMKLQPGGWVLPTNFTKFSKYIYNFEVRPSDVCVVTYPRSGTTWTLEMVWNLMHNPDLNNPDANNIEKYTNFDVDTFRENTRNHYVGPDEVAMKEIREKYPDIQDNHGLTLRLAKYLPSPRLLKSHFPFSLMPPRALDTCKVVFVVRDPRDVIVSMFCYSKLQYEWKFTGTLDEFLDDFLEDRTLFGPYWTHLKEAWDRKDHPNMCFLYYEDLKNNTFSEMKRLNTFLGTDLNDEQIKNILHHTSFSQMKERTKDNPPYSNSYASYDKEVLKEEGGFFRKGQIGDWKLRFSPEQQEKLNSWMKKNLKYFGPGFKYEV